MIQIVLIILSKIFLALILIILLIRFFNLNYNSKPRTIGLSENKFNECPETSNCVSSMTRQIEKQIDAISYNEPFQNVRDRITITVHQFNNTTLIKSDSNYFHFEFRTFPLAFTDDVEFLIDSENQLVHLKSSSRLGRYDFGTNRRRLNKFITIFRQVE